jgi:hypothetical protein
MAYKNHYNTTTDRLLEGIRKNTENINLNVDTLEVNTDGLETLITASNVDLAAMEVLLTSIKTAVEILDNAISGTEMQVDIVSAGANDLLKFGNSGCDMISGNAAQSVSTGTYFAVQFLKACTPTNLDISNSTAVENVEIPAGTIIYGDITGITGDSGAFYVLYKGNPA